MIMRTVVQLFQCMRSWNGISPANIAVFLHVLREKPSLIYRHVSYIFWRAEEMKPDLLFL